MEVLDGVHVIQVSYTNVYLVTRGKEALLIDAGPPDPRGTIESYLGELGLRAGDLSLVVATHSHWDHVGGLPCLQRRYGLKAAAHSLEAPYLRSGRPPVGRSYEPVEIHLELRGGEVLGSLQVIHVPGHTPGSIALLDTHTGALFIGDLAYEQDGMLYEIPSRYSLDPALNRESIRRVAALRPRHVLPGHGDPIIGSGAQALEDLAARL